MTCLNSLSPCLNTCGWLETKSGKEGLDQTGMKLPGGLPIVRGDIKIDGARS